MNKVSVSDSVADHIVEEVRRLGAEGNNHQTNIVVFCIISHECSIFTDAVIGRLQHSRAEIGYRKIHYRTPYFIRCRYLSTGSEIHIRFLNFSVPRGTRGFGADHTVAIGLSLDHPVMLNMILASNMQNKTTAVIVTTEELKENETKLQPLKSWEATHNIDCTILLLLRLFIIPDGNKSSS